MSAIAQLDWPTVRDHYDNRESVHRRLLQLHASKKTDAFVRLLLGIDDPAGNYSANEHNLGPMILSMNPGAPRRLYELANDFLALRSARDVPSFIKAADLRYFQIGVGSEASCMINPAVCWVANTRTIWTHLVIKHADNFARADQELRLYRDDDATSEMKYAVWTRIHADLEVALKRIAEQGERLAGKEGVTPGPIKFLWADAIANALYADHHG